MNLNIFVFTTQSNQICGQHRYLPTKTN